MTDRGPLWQAIAERPGGRWDLAKAWVRYRALGVYQRTRLRINPNWRPE